MDSSAGNFRLTHPDLLSQAGSSWYPLQSWGQRTLSISVTTLLFLLQITPLTVNGQLDWTPPLPPELPWDGSSQSLLVDEDDPWITPSEQTELTRTPSYEETIFWLQRLARATPDVHLVSLGVSHEQRDIWMVVASRGGASTPAELRGTGKPILMIQAGIHPGEIDGKDAGLMLLRDMTVRATKRQLLENANVLFIPILSVDGHERSSPYGRVNQRGPVETGWRTNAYNLNLNRDYSKLDTPEMRALVQAINQWTPDLYLDIHVTDGIDYQYDITFGYNGTHAYSPRIATWLDEALSPTLRRDLQAMGHIPGPLVFAVDNLDPRQGIVEWTASPRFSTGYGDVRHLPTVLVENHSLKPYRQRVLGTYVLLESTLRTLANEYRSLRRAVSADRNRAPQDISLTWTVGDIPQEQVTFAGVSWETEPSEISGRDHIRWTGEPVALRIPNIRFTQPGLTVARPMAYWIPAAWTEVIDRLASHGIYMERMAQPRVVDVEMYRFSEVTLAGEAFEGRIRVMDAPGSIAYTQERRQEWYSAGSVRVPTDQPLGDLAVLLLEPGSPDSFFQWGFFLSILQPTEYIEGYVIEPLAERMLSADPELQTAFRQLLETDSEFAQNPDARLRWFYERTPFFDERWQLYPVGRE